MRLKYLWEQQEKAAQIARKVIIRDNAYGYTLNVNNPVLNVLYSDFKKRYGIYGAPADKQRSTWEYCVKVYICRKYNETYGERLYAPVIAHIEERVNDVVANMDITDACDEICKLYERVIKKQSVRI